MIEHTAAFFQKKSSETHQVVSGGLLPLSMVSTGNMVYVKSIRGKDKTRHFLENLGFVENASVCVVSELGGNVIVNVKGTRVAISKSMAARILTC